jgi:osmoprotectant transport system substrate-binding protein
MKPSWRRLLGLLLVMFALIATAAGCGGDDDDADTAATSADTTADTSGDTAAAGGDTPTIVLGTKNFTEQYILGELYKQALEAKGYTVELKSDIGSTEIIDTSLTSGQINMYPEYTGTALTVVFGQEGSEDTAEATYEAAKAAYEERGQTLFEMTPFSDSDAIAVLKTYADANGLEAIGDLAKVDEFRLGGQPEFRTRAQGLPGLEENYGLTNVEFVPFAGISPYEALDQERVEAAAIFSTDPPLASGKYTVLDDTEAQFGFQNVAPVVDQELADAGGQELADAVNAVTELLTEEAIISMNSAVAIDQRQPAEVAQEFLEANDLL